MSFVETEPVGEYDERKATERTIFAISYSRILKENICLFMKTFMKLKLEKFNYTTA